MARSRKNTPKDFVVTDRTRTPQWLFPNNFAKGLVPRDFKRYPVGYQASAPPAEIKTISRSDYSAIIKENNERGATLRHIRRGSGPNGGPIPSLDQNGVGYCWNHSATMAVIMARAVMGLTYVRLSAFFIGCIIKNYRDEGGWGALGLDFITEHGVPSVEFWPEKSMSRSNDTPAMRENALLHRVTDGWIDLGTPVYNRNLTNDQIDTLLLCGIPVVADFNWWSHSVLLLCLEEKGANNFVRRGINSWTDQWGDMGEFVLEGNKAKADGAVAPLIVTPSMKQLDIWHPGKQRQIIERQFAAAKT